MRGPVDAVRPLSMPIAAWSGSALPVSNSNTEPFESALRSLSATQQAGQVTDRTTLAGPGSPSWIVANTGGAKLVSHAVTVGDYFGYALTFGVPGSSTVYTILIQAEEDTSKTTGSGAPVANFVTTAASIIDQLAGSPYANDRTDPNSLMTGMAALQNFTGWLEDWVSKINAWGDAVGDSASDWQGSAAGAFQYTLRQFAGEFQNVQDQMHLPTRWEGLEPASIRLSSAIEAISSAFSAWSNSPLSLPTNCLGWVLARAMNGATVYYGTSTTDTSAEAVSPGSFSSSLTFSLDVPGYGNPTTQAFWDVIDQNAKDLWLNYLSEAVDRVVQPAMQALDSSYLDAAKDLGTLFQVSMTTPNSSLGANAGGGNDNLNIGGDGGDGNLDVGAGGSVPNIDTGGSANGFNLGSSANTPDLSGAISAGGGQAGDLNTNTGDLGIGGAITGSGSVGNPGDGSEDSILGPNGQVLDDASGDPLDVPAGSTIGPDGEVIGPNGSPVLGANGQPITVPEGSTLQSNGAGGNVVVPQGSKINPNGTVTAPDGKEVLDSNGNPLVLAKGSTIGADGTVLGPDGKTVPLDSQLLTDQEQALANQTGSTVLDGVGGSPLSGSVPTVGGAQITGGGSVLSQDAIARGAVPGSTFAGTGTTQSVQTTGGSAAGDGAATSTTTASEEESGMDMPMMPGMGGGGMGQQNGQDRQRTTWLAEEEEVWGTEIDAVSGTIGR